MAAPTLAEPFVVVRLDLPFDTETFDRTLLAVPGIQLRVGAARGDDEATGKALAKAHAYHVSSAQQDLPRHWFVDRALLQRCPQLLAVSTYGAGSDTVDLAACTDAGVCVVNQAGSNANAVAEHAFALILGLSRRVAECDRKLRRGDRFARQDMQGRDLAGRTLGLVGLGQVGRRMVELARAFGMTVLASGRAAGSLGSGPGGDVSLVALEELLARSDIVSLHCPLTPETTGLFGTAAFAAMKPGALFVTTARGGIHDEEALEHALASGHLGGAGLDVWEEEPPPQDHPLMAFDNVIATRHIAGATQEAHRQMAAMGASQIIALAQGRRPPRLLNPAVWPVYANRFRNVVGRPCDWS